MNDWLEDLSEDWVSQPRSSSSPSSEIDLLPTKSPSQRNPSRSVNGSTSFEKQLHGTRPGSAQESQQRSALIERSFSQLNILQGSTSSDNGSKQLRSGLPRRSISAESSQSVVIHSTVARKSLSASPPKSRRRDTPEWKRRLLNGDTGFGNQKDLFSPSGLEKMFQKPQSTRPSSSKDGSKRLSFLRALEAIPSSPPPWPSEMSTGHTSAKKAEASTLHELGTLEEEPSLEAEDRGGRSSSQESAAHIPEAPDRNGETPGSDESMSLNKTSQQSKLSMRADKMKVGAASRVVSGQTGTSSDFSPVFISKHNTADGRVDYAALDMSRTQLENRLREWKESQASMRTTSAASHGKQLKHMDESSLSRLQSEMLPDDLPVGTPEVESLGDFVTVQRGGLSNDGSFMRRPLSPSPRRHTPSLVLEDDSVIQVGSTRDADRMAQEAPSPSAPPNFNDPSSQSEDTVVRGPIGQPVIAGEGTPISSAGHVYEETPSEGHAEPVALSQRFGKGDLDEYPFPMDVSIASATDQSSIDSLLSQSPPPSVLPPGSRCLTKFRSGSSSSNAPVNTFRGKRQLSKISSKSALSVGKRSDRSFKQSVQGEPEVKSPEPTQNATEGKRPLTSPSKNPTPKRRRTLVAVDIQHVVDQASVLSVRGSSQRMQFAFNRKRKDARYDSGSNIADPETLARRHILRPRNPTPSQRRQQNVDDMPDTAEGFRSSSPRFELIEYNPQPKPFDRQSNFRGAPIPLGTNARLSDMVTQVMKDDSRKRSVTTQDFLDEAMKIMSFIRAKGRPTSALASLEESEHESYGIDLHSPSEAEDPSHLTVSRPPSRDGIQSREAWRSRQKELDPRVVDHLRKYQETNEDGEFTFGNSVNPHGVNPPVGHTGPHLDMLESEPPGVRIISPSTQSSHSADEINPAKGAYSPDTVNSNGAHGSALSSQPATHQTSSSVDSSLGRTVSSRKSEHVGTIAPDAVEHLLHGNVGGMVFDKELGAWVRSPKKEKAALDRDRLHADISGVSQNPSEEDPFCNIPDLTVDESLENMQRRPSVQRSQDGPASEQVEKTLTSLQPPNLNQHHKSADLNGSLVSLPPVADSSLNEPAPPDVHSPPETSLLYTEVVQADGAESVGSADHDIRVLESRAAQQLPPITSTEVSIQPLPTEVPSQESEVHIVHQDLDSHVNSQIKSPWKASESPMASRRTYQSLQKTALHNAANMPQFPQGLRSPSVTRQTNLVFSTPIPKQRQFSLAVSLSKKSELPEIGQERQEQRRTLIESPPKQTSSPYRADVTFFLSDLPEFTINQCDERELPERRLLESMGNVVLHRGFQLQPGETCSEDRFAEGNHLLVKALQEEEVNEPYWENLRQLTLQNRNLTSLHLLDVFCAQLETLDVSNNALAQVAGVTQTLRYLNVSRNSLTSITAWAHLPNLQYVDVSYNKLDSLAGFESLVHLRELRADGNTVKSIDGVTQLDGLLKLSLRGNNISSVDFTGTRLCRLAYIDFSNNSLKTIAGLHHLPELRELVLDGNELGQFPTDPANSCLELQILRLNSNDLQTVDLASYAPDLRELYLDNNQLSNTRGFSGLTNLEILSLRSQLQQIAVGGNLKDSIPNLAITELPDVSALYLSNNHFPHFNLPHDLPSLKHLELASCGIQSLPANFRARTPNLRTLNLNFNHLQHLDPLWCSKRLTKLSAVGNQLVRMRKNVAVLSTMPRLATVDLRDNTVTHGFYSIAPASTAPQTAPASEQRLDKQRQQEQRQGQPPPSPQDQFALPSRDRAADAQHLVRLDDATRLRRRVYELLLASSCPALREVDGLPFAEDMSEAEKVKGKVVEKLVQMGVCRKLEAHESSDAAAACGHVPGVGAGDVDGERSCIAQADDVDRLDS